MKKLFFMALAVAMTMTACENYDLELNPQRQITFALDGDWQGSEEAFTTRAAVSGSAMTDVWVLDYPAGATQPSAVIHQTSADDDFGAPTLSLSYGDHTLYFVTSSGESPVLNTNSHTLTFGTPRDTFWRSVAVSVTSGTAANQSVTMDRIITKLAILPTDEVPTTVSTITIAPATWYVGFDYLTGNPTTAVNDYSRSFTIPDNYKGSTGTLRINLMGFCGADYNTNVSVTAKDADNNTIGYAVISNAPMKRNRTSRFSGTLFGNSNALSLNINDEWLTEFSGSW